MRGPEGPAAKTAPRSPSPHGGDKTHHYQHGRLEAVRQRCERDRPTPVVNICQQVVETGEALNSADARLEVLTPTAAGHGTANPSTE